MWLLALTLCVLVAARIATVFAADGNVNQDEGWYLYAARLLYHGAVPYRDFAFFQAPLLPLVYGLPQALFGPGLWIGRLTSLALTAITFALAFRIAHERAGRVAALLTLLLLSLTPYAVWAMTSTRTEPLTAVLWMASAWLLLRQPVTRAASAGALGVAVLAVATRISSLPAAGLVLLIVVARHRGSRRDLVGALAPSAAGALALAGFLLACGPESVFFDLVTAQALRHTQLRPAEAWGIADLIQTRFAALLGVPAVYGVAAVIAAPAGLVAAIQWLRTRSGSGSRTGAAALLGVLAAAVYLPNLAPRFVHAVYFTAAFPLCVVLTACVLGWAGERARGVWRPAWAAAVIALVAFQAVNFANRFGASASLAHPPLEQVHEIGRELARLVPEGGKLLTLDIPLAVESGRPVVPGFEMGMFAWSPGWPAEWARRFHLATPALWEAALRDPSVGAVALSDLAIGVMVKHHFRGYRPRREMSQEELRGILPGLRRFRLAKVVPHFGQARDPLYIWLPILGAGSGARGTGNGARDAGGGAREEGNTAAEPGR